MSNRVNNISDYVISNFASSIDIKYIKGADSTVLKPFWNFDLLMSDTSVSYIMPTENQPFPGLDCRIGKTLCHVGPGDCLICPAGSYRSFFYKDSDSGHRSIWVHLNILLNSNFQFVHFFDIPYVIHGDAAARIRGYLDILNRGSKNILISRKITEISGRRTETLAEQLEDRAVMMLILKEILDLSTPKETLKFALQGFHELEPAIQFIQKHKFEKISLDDLASICHYSRSAFEKKFRAAFGISPGKYLLNLRLSEAEHLLRNSDDTCAMIAEKTGFANQFIFSRQFRSRCGVSPSEYRREKAFC